MAASVSPSYHSSCSTNEAIASAAKKEADRFEVFASADRRRFVVESRRIESVSVTAVFTCVQVNADDVTATKAEEPTRTIRKPRSASLPARAVLRIARPTSAY